MQSGKLFCDQIYDPNLVPSVTVPARTQISSSARHWSTFNIPVRKHVQMQAVFLANDSYKTAHRSRLTDARLEQTLNICASSLKPDIDKLVKKFQSQSSHIWSWSVWLHRSFIVVFQYNWRLNFFDTNSKFILPYCRQWWLPDVICVTW